MSLNTRIKERREELKISRNKLAEMIGVTSSAIANYENGISSPKIELLYKLFNALQCDANYLYQDEMKQLNNDFVTSLPEQNLIQKYRTLTEYDKESVDMLVDRLYLREEPRSYINIEPPKVIDLYPRLASAGTGQYLFDDIPAEKIEVEWDCEADFAIGVQGDSMEPTYHNEDTLLVKKQNNIEVGNIGIFIVNGESFVKEYQKDRLVSHNKEYEDIEFNEHMSIVCVGKVIGTYE